MPLLLEAQLPACINPDVQRSFGKEFLSTSLVSLRSKPLDCDLFRLAPECSCHSGLGAWSASPLWEAFFVSLRSKPLDCNLFPLAPECSCHSGLGAWSASPLWEAFFVSLRSKPLDCNYSLLPLNAPVTAGSARGRREALFAMMEDFVKKHPQLWNEDIGV